MAEPTIRFRKIPITTAAGSLNTPAKRLAAIVGESVVDATDVDALDFNIVDITDGTATSNVQMLLWDVVGDGGNIDVSTFKLWLGERGFNQPNTRIMFKPISGADQLTPALTENYVQNAITSSYTFGLLDESEPAAINLYPSDEGSSMALAANRSDDVLMVAMYITVDAAEEPGIYIGASAGFEHIYELKYTYA